MERSLWKEAFSLDRPPRFPCPFCFWELRGRLQPDRASLRIDDPVRAREFRERSGGLAIFEFMRPRFQLTLRCEDPLCGEAVAVAGTVAPWEAEVGGRVTKRVLCYEEALYPAFFRRAPPIIDLPDTQGGVTALLVEKSFALFWIDLEACANCLRRSIEAILDDCGAPSRIEKGGRLMPFSWRVQWFARQSEPIVASKVAESFKRLADLGHMGSHFGREVTRDSILDAYELLEVCERDLYGDHEARIDQLKQRIAEATGKP